jgi:1,4-dihydroxy-2-naphthoate octaprenyltransferase
MTTPSIPSGAAAAAPVSKRQAWILAARPKTLPAAVGPVLVGVALAWALGHFALLPALAALLGALLLQIGSNFANDYFDFKKGADTHERLGPTRATAAGLLSANEMRMGMVVVFALAALVGLYLVWVGGVPILVVGVSAILAAILYTGGPLPYGYYGLGELFVFIFFGLAAVVGTYYVQALSVAPQAWTSAVPVGALVTAILVVNNLRDRVTDARAKKRTLAVLLGKRGAQIEYLALLAVAGISSVMMALLWSWWLLLPLLSAWFALPLVRSVLNEEGRALNKTLAGTSRLSLIYSLLLALGWLLAG